MSHLGGLVTNAKDFQGKTQINRETQDGLFSQVIFGPIRDHQCLCGKYNSINFDNQICPKCNVLCGSSDLRFTQFGEIQTIFPYIKTTKQKLVIKYLGQLCKLIIDPKKSDVNIINKRYLAVKYDKTKLKIVKTLNSEQGYLVIPFRITGIYTLFLGLTFLHKHLNVPIATELITDNIFTKSLKVLPPNARMFTIDIDQNKKRFPIINKYYKSVLNCNKINLPFADYLHEIEPQIIEKIRITIKSGQLTQAIVESEFFEYDIKSCAYQEQINNIYAEVYKLLSGKPGIIRKNILGKSVEFSARSVIKIDPSLNCYQITAPHDILKELWGPYFVYWLTKYKDYDYTYCFNKILLEGIKNEENERLFQEFLVWFCQDKYELKRLMFLNRAPTLYSHSIPTVQVLPNKDKNDLTIGISPLTLAPMNADLDGDTLALFAIADQSALKEMHDKSYLKYKFKYDSNETMLATLRHEALYGMFIISSFNINYDKVPIQLTSLDLLPENFDYWNYNLDCPVNFINKTYSYGMCLINKWAGFDSILINQFIGKSESELVSKIIFEFNQDKFHDNLHNLNRQILFFISSTDHCPSINVNEMINMLNDKIEHLFMNLPKNNPYIGTHINEALIDKCLTEMNKDCDLYKLFKSGSRFSKSQLARTCMNIGYIADAQNIVSNKPITSNLIKGLNQADFLETSLGARKGVVDKSKSTPESGYMQRTLSMALSPLEIIENDCGTDLHIDTIVFSKTHAKTLTGKYYRDIYSNDRNWKILDFNTAKTYINKKISIRSPITCQTQNFQICKKCFGARSLRTNYVGIMAGQLVSERLTQLVMRTFHTSGAANLDIDENVKQFIHDHLINIKNINGKCELYFDSNPVNIFDGIEGFLLCHDNVIVFDEIKYPVENNDVIAILVHIKQILKTQTIINKHPTEYYEELMSYLLEVGTLFSSFVECIFANMFLTNKDPNVFWRYNQNNKIVYKSGQLNMAYNIRPRLSCLFQPNIKSLPYLTDNTGTKLTLYEKIWLDKL